MDKRRKERLIRTVTFGELVTVGTSVAFVEQG